MAANPFDQFDAPKAYAPVSSIPGGGKPYAPVSSIPGGANPFDQFDTPQHAGAGQNWLQKALGMVAGPVEAGLSMATGAVAAPIGSLYGVGYGLTHGYGTQKGANVAEQKGAQLTQRLTYHPQSPQGQQLVGAAGSAFDKSGIMGLGPDMSLLTQGLEGARMASPAVGRAADVGATALGRAADRATPVVRPVARAAAAPIQAVGRGANYLFNPEASAGAKAARGMAAALPKELPAPMPEPRAPGAMPSLEPPLAGSKMASNAALRQAFEGKASALDAQREELGKQLGAVADQKDAEAAPAATDIASMEKRLADLKAQYAPYEKTAPEVQARPVPSQLRAAIAAQQKELDAALTQARGAAGVTPSESIDTILKYIKRKTPQEGSEAARTELGRIARNLEYVKNNAPNKLSALIDLRREVSDRAKFGEPMRGADLLGPKQSRDLASLINGELDKHLSDYKGLREQYSALLDQQQPLDASFFKDLGNDETSGGDMAARILSSPENLAKANAALGDPKALDGLLAKHVAADVAGKSAKDIAQYIKEREPVLKDLPQAQRVAMDAQSAQEARDALKAVRAQADKQYDQNMRDFAHSTKLQTKYAGQFTRLNELPPRKMPAGLRATLTDMYNDGIIKLDRYQDALRQVKAMEASITRQSHVLKYTGVVTATSFATYALHRKMWNIIVGATR